ncbi:hypothetical protein LSCM4_02327 [Leishmania orientalis]|uniref:Uncharacterized protein n=1 Tax=Leishmania orientalis TaxID=2249476 RepID=A0A836KA55_9TRYP|nr:hypothetical protein LSCM4_02327 [Leishmania orientalis]
MWQRHFVLQGNPYRAFSLCWRRYDRLALAELRVGYGAAADAFCNNCNDAYAREAPSSSESSPLLAPAMTDTRRDLTVN